MSTREWFEEWLLDEKKPKQQKPEKSHSAVWVAYHDDEPNMDPDPITAKDIPRLAGMSILLKLVIAALIGAVLLIVANSNG